MGLGINDGLLRQIENDRKVPGVLQCLLDTLMLWLSMGNVNIATLANAVELSGYKRLARTIRSKYEGTSWLLSLYCFITQPLKYR